MKFQGLYTAIVTPFAGNRVDEEAFRMLVEAQIAAGVAGIVAVGTTGESPTLTVKEHLRVIELAVESAAGRIQVIAGTGANSTAEAIHMTQEAEKMGVDGTLQVCPYYNKPSQDGVYAHFKAIADATRLPMMLYSIPGRCGIEISVETISRLAKDCPHIVCVKEAGGNVDRVNQLMQVVPENFTVLCGDDGLTVPFMACGASGLVSVTSNLLPGIMNSIVKAGLNQDMGEMLSLQKTFYPLMKGLMTLDSNPVPIKAALAMRGDIQPGIRLPLVPLAEEKEAQLSALLSDMISILVTGISGRMGQAIQEAVTQNPDTCVGSTHDQGQELYPALAKCDVAIDFSHHAFTSTLLAEAVANNKPLVIGTTGHTELERQEIVDAAASIPIVFASNYSVGVNALFWLTRKAAQILGGSCDIEVMEMHHRHKIDAPSGTARTLAEILSSAIDRNYEDSVVFGREGLVGPRPAKEIGMHSLRGGDVVGDHTVIFASDGERLELTHKASSRMTFASGAVRAALWLQGREPGLYTMEDVLGLSQL